jgi:hypothetical protein
MEKSNKSIVFGLIALALALLCTFLPKSYVVIPVILGIILGIVGYFKDGKKWPSVIALTILLLMGIFDASESYEKANIRKSVEDTKNKTYSIKYKVSAGSSFDVGYNNETGGMNHTKGSSHWEKTVTLKGTDFAYVTAQKTEGTGSITVNLYVNGVLKKTATSSGEYSIADASCYPYKP